jgi:hypothetical protein
LITINAEKGLIRVENWEDIESRPGFVKDLDPSRNRLSAIIGQYVFRDRIRCGLSNCHTPHSKGYIVATTDGYETNIGKDCGRTHFGVEFEALSRKFDRDVTTKERRERLWSLRFRQEAAEAAVDGLLRREWGANWVHRHLRPLTARHAGCPDVVVDCLANMVKLRQSVLTAEREATKEEIEREEARIGRRLPLPHYVQDPVANIAGLPALYAENSLRDLLVLDLQERLAAFRAADIDALTPRELHDWAKWVDAFDNKLERAAQILAESCALLDPTNLRPLLKIIKERPDEAEFRTYLKGLAEDLGR